MFLLLWAVVFFIAFMTAFGNDTPTARVILRAVEVFAVVADPVWGIPLSYGIGAALVHRAET